MKSLIQKLCETNGHVSVNESVVIFEDGSRFDLSTVKETPLHEFLEGAQVAVFSKYEKGRHYENTGREFGCTSLCRVSLINGRVILAESRFTEPVKGFLHFWTPLEDETFMLVPHSAILSIAYSE